MRSLLFAVLVLSASWTHADDICRTINNVARIHTATATGTGFVFEETPDQFRLLTAAHVVQTHTDCNLNFFGNGKQSHEIPGKIIWTDLIENQKDVSVCRDIALIEVQKADFNGFPYPPVIKLAKRGTEIKPETLILSVGCPAGNWPSCFVGHVFETKHDNIFHFKPEIIPGRSGSPIFNVRGDAVHGIIIWYNFHSHVSTGLSLSLIYDALDAHRLPIHVDPND